MVTQLKFSRTHRIQALMSHHLVHITKNTSWMEKKRNIPVEKMFKWRVGRAFLPKNLKTWSFTTNGEKNATMEQC
jgi:hypothetical protein